MPFDSLPPEIDLTELQPGKAGLRQLAYLLCHPEEWPEGHVWDFDELLTHNGCGTNGCVLAIAELKWPTTFSRFQGDLFRHSYRTLFYSTPHYTATVYGTQTSSQVTPTMVADAIEHFLATGRVPTGGEAVGAL